MEMHTVELTIPKLEEWYFLAFVFIRFSPMRWYSHNNPDVERLWAWVASPLLVGMGAVALCLICLVTVLGYPFLIVNKLLTPKSKMQKSLPIVEIDERRSV